MSRSIIKSSIIAAEIVGDATTLQRSVSAGPNEQVGPARRRRRKSLLTHLVVLVLAATLPLMAAAAVSLWIQFDSERDRAEGLLVNQARLLARVADGRLRRTMKLAEILSVSSAVSQGDLATIQQEFAGVDRVLEGGSSLDFQPPEIVITDSVGRALLDSFPPAQRQYRALPPIQSAIASGQSGISNLLVDPATGSTFVCAIVPIQNKVTTSNGQAVGAVIVLVPQARLTSVVTSAELPAGAFASLQDRIGVTVARSFREAETRGKLPTPPVLHAIMGQSAGTAPQGSRTLEGIPSVIAFAHAPETGFIIKLDVPEEMFLAPLRSAILRSAAIWLAVLASGLALAFFYMRRISEAFRRALPATGPLSSDARVPGSTGLREADDLAAAFRAILTERDRAFTNLQQADATIRALFENSPVGVVVADRGGRITSANDAFLAIIGGSRTDLQGGLIHWDEITPEEWASADEAAIAEALATGRCTPYEKEYVRPDGTRVPVLITYGVVDRATGVVASFIVDLAEQKTAAAALRESEERYRALASATQEGIVIRDNGRVVEVNDAYWRMFGYESRDDLIGRDCSVMITPEGQADVLARMAKGLNSPFESTAVRADGRTFPVELQGYSIRYQGKPMRVGIARDLTRQKAAEKALRESEARFRTLADAMPQLVWSARADGYNDYSNARFHAFTGLPDGALVGDRWRDFVHPDDLPALSECWNRSLQSHETYEAECRLRRHDGVYRSILVRAVPILDDDGSVIRWFGTNTDITDIVEAREVSLRGQAELEALVEQRTEALRETERQLAHAQRMQALGQLAGGIAHDFNNVLQTVQGAGSLIRLRSDEADDVRRYADLMMQAAERGAAITHRLLAFSRRSALKAEAVNASALLDGIKEMLGHTLGAGIDIRLVIPARLPPMLVDKGQLETVLVNLATNARDAMAGRGTLTITATGEVCRLGSRLRYPIELPLGSYIRISVADTGCGMDADTLARVTEPFFTTKGQGQGTGLGLAMARGFAEQSNGGLHIHSAPGNGTTVTLYIPAASAAYDPPESTEHRKSSVVTAQRTRLVLVDDDAAVRAVLGEQIKRSGVEVAVFDSAHAALAHLDQDGAADVLVSDLSMPGMDGLTLIQEAQRRRPGMPSILLTGHATEAAETAAKAAAQQGTFTLLRKPIDGKKLAEQAVSLLADAFQPE